VRAGGFAAEGAHRASIAPADRRADSATQIAFPTRIALPSYRSAAAWKITDPIALHARRQTVELADNPHGLVIFLDLSVNLADNPVVGGDGVADPLGAGGGDIANAISQRH
jgi:hypothetical protein